MNHVSDGELISKIYKELKQLNRMKINHFTKIMFLKNPPRYFLEKINKIGM